MLDGQILHNYSNSSFCLYPWYIGPVKMWTLYANFGVPLLHLSFLLSPLEQALLVPTVVELLASLAKSKVIALFV